MSSGVLVTTPSRLHFSLIDLNSDLGRVDGGVGVALSYPRAKVSVRPSRQWSVPEELAGAVRELRERAEPRGVYDLRIEEPIPSHVGLGSHTQLALAAAKGIMAFEKKRMSVPDLARLVGRGGTSGIGVGAFEYGGFLIDGGHRWSEKGAFLPSSASKVGPPPVLFQAPLPRDWAFVVAIPPGKKLHGRAEADFFKRHTPVPRKEVAHVARIVLMVLMPAAIERDIDAFGAGLIQLQDVGFKRREVAFQSDAASGLHTLFHKAGVPGYGQSSFGPATYALVRGWKKAEEIGHDALHEMGEKGHAYLCPVAEGGATVRALTSREAGARRKRAATTPPAKAAKAS